MPLEWTCLCVLTCSAFFKKQSVVACLLPFEEQQIFLSRNDSPLTLAGHLIVNIKRDYMVLKKHSQLLYIYTYKHQAVFTEPDASVCFYTA